MPILEIGTAKRGMLAERQEHEFLAARVQQKAIARERRTLTSGNTPALLGGGGGSQGGFAGGKVNRLTGDFLGRATSADQDLFADNRRLRWRGRELGQNNAHFAKFLQLAAQNIVGQKGIQLQAKVRNAYGKRTAQTDLINQRLEQAWTSWGRKGSCTADGRWSFRSVQIMAIKNAAREGENLVKGVLGREFNSSAFALQLLDNDQLDDTMMLQDADNGNQVRMGVEVDRYQRPQAYWLFSGHPTDPFTNSRDRKRIPADQIVHSFIAQRAGQTRGHTWGAAAILAMNQLGRLEEATVIAARTAAAKFGVIQNEGGQGYGGEEEAEDGADTNADGTQYMSANAGEFMELAPGQTFQYLDPKYPTQAYEPFSRTLIRTIATGLFVAYPSLGNDLNGVNFSSIRAGLLEERDSWKILQQWFIEDFLQPVFDAWFQMARLTVLKDLVITDEQIQQIVWRPRGWAWVDPLKDGQASVLDIENGFNTRSAILAERGLDFEDVARELKYEQDFLSEIGLVLGTDLQGDQGGKGVAAGDETEAAEATGADADKPKPAGKDAK